jgi:putative endonuclease
LLLSFRGRTQAGTRNRFIFGVRWHSWIVTRAIIARLVWGNPMREPAVYMLATKPYRTLYVGVTSDLVKRIWEHRNNATDGFTKRYGVHRLVHFEQFRSMVEAIEREKELKKWRRAWKISLVEEANPDWRDLWPEISQ